MGEIENFSKLLYRQVVSLAPHSVFDVLCSVFSFSFYFRENEILCTLHFLVFYTPQGGTDLSDRSSVEGTNSIYLTGRQIFKKKKVQVRIINYISIRTAIIRTIIYGIL